MKKVLSKDEFCSYLDNVLKREKNAETLSKALQIYANDREFTGFTENSDFDIEFLESLLEDENHWISWWFYEAKQNPKKYRVEFNGIKYVIESPSDLYDFLFQENNEEKNPYYEGGILCIDTINRMINQGKNTIEKREKEGKSTEKLNSYVALLKMAKSMMINDLAMIGNLYLVENEDK